MAVPPVYPRPVYIYALIDPETDEVRYVGQSVCPEQRLRRHLRDHELKHETYKNHWLKGLLARGLRPSIEVLEQRTAREWAAAERRWIAHVRALGAPLTNATDGGEGTLGRLWTEAMHAMRRARRVSDETRAKISASQRARGMAPEQIALHQRQMRALRSDPAIVAKREAARLQSNRTPEFRAKISATQKGRRKSPEHRAKIAAGHRGKKHSAQQTLNQMIAANATKARKKAQRIQEAGQLCLFTNRPEGS